MSYHEGRVALLEWRSGGDEQFEEESTFIAATIAAEEAEEHPRHLRVVPDEPSPAPQPSIDRPNPVVERSILLTARARALVAYAVAQRKSMQRIAWKRAKMAQNGG